VHGDWGDWVMGIVRRSGGETSRYDETGESFSKKNETGEVKNTPLNGWLDVFGTPVLLMEYWVL
jgi:hypothetical protein